MEGEPEGEPEDVRSTQKEKQTQSVEEAKAKRTEEVRESREEL